MQNDMYIDDLTLNVQLPPQALKHRELRKESRKSFAEIEKDSGIPRIDLMRYEMGQLIPPNDVYQKLLKYYS